MSDIKKTIETLREFNLWRRADEDMDQPDPREIGEAIDAAIKAMEELNEWKTLTSWGGTPEIINDFIKGQQSRIYAAQEAEEQRDKAQADLNEERTPMRTDTEATVELWQEQAIHNLQAAEDFKLELADARREICELEKQLAAMESAGAEQARRADENREWSLKVERERDAERALADLLASSLLLTLSAWITSPEAERAAASLRVWKEARGE